MMTGYSAKTFLILPMGERPTAGSQRHLIAARRGYAYFYVSLHTIVYTLRVRHILQHDVADLEGGLAKAKLEELNSADLNFDQFHFESFAVRRTSLTAS